MGNRWLRVLDQKPIPVFEHLLGEAARLLANDLSKWPLEVFEVDEKVQLLLRETPVRPGALTFAEAFRLTRWDLARDFDAIDDYWRNQRHLEHGLSPADKPMVLFLTRFISEQLLSLSEATEGRVARRHLLDVLDRIERHLAAKELT